MARLSRAEIFDPSEIVAFHTMARTDLNSIRNDPVKLASVRSRLSDISWWMRLLCQYIALRANGEEGKGLGRFWQSRFKAVRILDEESLLACAANVDLNPIRAALAKTLEASDYTSVQRRITTLKENVAAIHDSNAVNSARITNQADDFLSPISIDEKNDPLSSQPSRNGKRCSDKGFLVGRMSHARPMCQASTSFPRRRESSGVVS